MLTARRVIELLGLEPLPVEGGYFRRSWVAAERLPAGALPERYRQEKALGSAIYYLVTPEPRGCSALHALRTDEVYHFYLGDPVELLLLGRDGRSEVQVLGPDLEAGQRVQAVAPGGAWQGTRLLPGGRWALLGATLAPGYDPEDFETPEIERLLALYPGERERILALAPVSQEDPGRSTGGDS